MIKKFRELAAILPLTLVACLCVANSLAQDVSSKNIPALTLVPLPENQVAFLRNEEELARYYFGDSAPRPFVYPIIGPSGRPLTRMGHPHDPHGHRHHRSVWVAHHDVGGLDFWADTGPGRITHDKLESLSDGEREATLITHNQWQAEDHGVLLDERRSYRVVDLDDGEWLLIVGLELTPHENEVTLGKTPFGPLGVRMAKSIGVHDGGGTIRNSEGGLNEKEVLWKPARWVDYSGPISAEATEGITLMDHPSNPRHPTVFHVRDDGWMGTSLTYNDALVLKPGDTLRLQYGLYVHRGTPSVELLDAAWDEFARAGHADDGPE